MENEVKVQTKVETGLPRVGVKKLSPKILLYAVLILYAVITLGPFIWSVITSLKPTSEIDKFAVNISMLTLDNYKMILTQFPFGRWFFNSFLVALIVTTGNILFNSMAGYALARINFPGRNFLFMLVLA
ncbi:multiple sugar transport system permease protein [Thermosediminibacter litoriperuensis]|uniref:Multiple sugar transport system permease protein n=1 Tax=Thermosediminibacter litoriperuensis TaxID=291989 RepID=A0A5S5AXB9_9FIRM|nr:hypothetical protein [Thermosediminibacter litoriperuensis]TYP57843.1 multiple sugar transport system permease protein [Thermosediminibacter litoriperuensis]